VERRRSGGAGSGAPPVGPLGLGNPPAHEKAPARRRGLCGPVGQDSGYWIETFRISTGSVGMEGEFAAVSACSIVVTTSIPEITLP
jgi:hypothetical protein